MPTSPPRPPKWATDWLSEPRATPYLRAAGDDFLKLYRWNSAVSKEMFELIGWFEVGWRNTVDRAITRRRPDHRPHWLLDPEFPLQEGSRAKITKARAKLRRGGRVEPSIGKLIGELPIGFWRFTMRGYTNTIWAPYLSRAFPHAPRRPRREEIDGRLHGIILCRNRIAHQEPARIDELKQSIDDIFTLGEWFNPQAAQWWREHTKVLEPLDQRPV